jgi:hypothetical protein
MDRFMLSVVSTPPTPLPRQLLPDSVVITDSFVVAVAVALVEAVKFDRRLSFGEGVDTEDDDLVFSSGECPRFFVKREWR